MKWLTLTLLILAFIITTPTTFGQTSSCDKCSEILKHGIYDHAVEQALTFNYRQTENEIKNAYSKYEKDNQKGETQGSAYYDLFNGGLKVDIESLKTMHMLATGESASVEQFKNFFSVKRDFINGGVVDAWKECVLSCDSEKRGLIVDTIYTDDDLGVKAITLSIHYKGDGVSPKFINISYPKNTFECESDLLGMEGKEMNNSYHYISCTRMLSEKPHVELEGRRRIHAPAADLSIHTSAGSITRHVAPIYESVSLSPELEARLSKIEAMVSQKVSDITVYTNVFNIGNKDAASSGEKEINLTTTDLTAKYPGKILQAWYFPIYNVTDVPAFSRITVEKLEKTDRIVRLNWISTRQALLDVMVVVLVKQ